MVLLSHSNREITNALILFQKKNRILKIHFRDFFFPLELNIYHKDKNTNCGISNTYNSRYSVVSQKIPTRLMKFLMKS